MPRHLEERVLNYPADQLFHLVADIASYPDFVPWCQEAKIVERYGNIIRADLTIGFKSVTENFTSYVTFEPPYKITVDYGGGPMKYLKNEWKFEALDTNITRVTFFIDFEMKSEVLGKLANMFFEKAFQKMVAAFEKRAEQLNFKN